jgi:hypothetical protein
VPGLFQPPARPMLRARRRGFWLEEPEAPNLHRCATATGWSVDGFDLVGGQVERGHLGVSISCSCWWWRRFWRFPTLTVSCFICCPFRRVDSSIRPSAAYRREAGVPDAHCGVGRVRRVRRNDLRTVDAGARFASRTHFGELDRELGLQEGMAAAANRFVLGKPVESLSPGIPELDRSVETPRKHWFIGQCNQTGQAVRAPGGN